MAQGKVKWFSIEKGFGFIRLDDGGNDVFVHMSVVERSGLQMLSGGQAVGFDLVENPKTGKLAAANLRRL